MNYKQCTTIEIFNEVDRDAKNELNELVEENIILLLDSVPNSELNRIKLLNPHLSNADCSLFYYVERIENSICLTDDYPLRVLCLDNNFETHGTEGIYIKLKNDNNFQLEYLERKFNDFKRNKRIFSND